jgi:hypothetical protein
MRAFLAAIAWSRTSERADAHEQSRAIPHVRADLGLDVARDHLPVGRGPAGNFRGVPVRAGLGLPCAVVRDQRRSLRFSWRDHAFPRGLWRDVVRPQYIAVYWASSTSPSGLVAIVFSTIVFMNPIGAAFAFGDR